MTFKSIGARSHKLHSLLFRLAGVGKQTSANGVAGSNRQIIGINRFTSSIVEVRRSQTDFILMQKLVKSSVDAGGPAHAVLSGEHGRIKPCSVHQYQRINGPYKLILSRTGEYKLPFGNLPRLWMAWISTEAVRTQSRELILGDSLSEFMRALGSTATAAGFTPGCATR